MRSLSVQNSIFVIKSVQNSRLAILCLLIRLAGGKSSFESEHLHSGSSPSHIDKKIACDDKTNTTMLFNKRERDFGEEISNERMERAFPVTKFLDELLGERLFNTTMNFIVPGAHVFLPRHTDTGSVDHLAMQAFFGLFWAIAWISTIAIPTVVTYFQPLGIRRSYHRSFTANKNSFDDPSFNFKWTLNDKVADAIGLNWTTCLHKTICQAHEYPQKYGMLGTTVRLIFPASDKLDNQLPPDNIETESEGSTMTSDNLDKCSRVYKCFFDSLDVLIYVKNNCYATYSNRN